MFPVNPNRQGKSHLVLHYRALLWVNTSKSLRCVQYIQKVYSTMQRKKERKMKSRKRLKIKRENSGGGGALIRDT